MKLLLFSLLSLVFVSTVSANCSARLKCYEKTVNALLNAQIEVELQGHYTYLYLSHIFLRNDMYYPKVAKYFREKSDEEMQHAEKFIEYQNQRGGKFDIGSVERKKDGHCRNIRSLKNGFSCAKHLEISVTAALTDLLRAIHVAVIHDQLEALTSLIDVVETLPESSKSLNIVNKQHQTALHIACLTDNIKALTDLLRVGADPLIPDKNGNTSLHVACRHGNPDILRRLLQSRHCQQQEIDIPNHNGLGLFHQAVKARKNNRKCLKLLNEVSCDVNMVDARSGRTALHMAVETNYVVVAGCLISDCEANLDLATYAGYTALHIAAANDCVEIAALLVACGAFPEPSTCPPNVEGGETPLDLAQSDKMREILSGKKVLNDIDCDKLLQETTTDVDDLWWSLDSIYRNRLCNLLNAQKTGFDWLALADRLDLRCERSVLKNSENPTNELIKSYSLHHGTCEGLRSALMAIGRHDVVQILNKAMTNSTNDRTVVANKIESCANEDRYDSGIVSES